MIFLTHGGVDINSDVHKLLDHILVAASGRRFHDPPSRRGGTEFAPQFHPSLSISGEGGLVATIEIPVKFHFPAFTPYSTKILTILIVPYRNPLHHTRKMACFR